MIIIDFRKSKAVILTASSEPRVNKNFDLPTFFTYNNTYTYIFGTHALLADNIETNLKFTDKKEFKNVYVSKSCNIPTISLQNNGITRKRSICSAEVSVIPYISKEVSNKKYDVWLYDDKYYFIPYDGKDMWIPSEVKPKMEEYLSMLTSDDGSLLKSLELIPDGAEKIFSGYPIKINYKHVHFFEELPYYKEVIYDTDFNKLLLDKKEDITEENLEYIKSLFRNQDLSMRDLGLNLMYSLNIQPYATKCAFLLSSYKYGIERCPFYKSTKMDNMLYNIGLRKSELGYEDRMLNKTFEYNIQSEKDRIRAELTQRYLKGAYYELSRLKQYRFFDGFKHNKIIITHDEKDYIYSGEQGLR